MLLWRSVNLAIVIPPRSQKSYPILSDAPVAFCKPCHCYPSSFPEVLPDTVSCSCGVLKTRPGLTKHIFFLRGRADQSAHLQFALNLRRLFKDVLVEREVLPPGMT